MNRLSEQNFEAYVVAVCAVSFVGMVLANAAVHIFTCRKSEPAPYSVCECCGQVLDGTNNVCVPEGIAEGSSK